MWGHVAHSPIKPNERLADYFKDIKVKKEDFGKHFWPKLVKSKQLNNDLDKNMAYYLGGLYSMDYNVGRLLDTIDELGLTNDTVIAFTGDHGAATMGSSSSTSQNMLGYCGGLRDYKHSYYEGGVRVPLVVRWPGTIPAGRTENSAMSFLDWLPTACSLANVPYNENEVEGENFADVWLGGDTRDRDKPLFWNKEGGGDFAMLSANGQWKLHFTVDDLWELYDLKNDIEENNNVVKCFSQKAQQMKEELRTWTKTLPEEYCRAGDCDKAHFGKLDRGQDGDGVQCNAGNATGNESATNLPTGSPMTPSPIGIGATGSPTPAPIPEPTTASLPTSPTASTTASPGALPTDRGRRCRRRFSRLSRRCRRRTASPTESPTALPTVSPTLSPAKASPTASPIESPAESTKSIESSKQVCFGIPHLL